MIMTETEHLTRYLNQRADKAASTLSADKLYIGRFTAWLAGREITPALLDEFRGHLAPQHMSPGTKNLVLAHVGPFIGWLHRQGLSAASADDVGQAFKSFTTIKSAPVVLDRAVIRQLVQAGLDNKKLAFLLPLIITGCRREELRTFKAQESGLFIMGDKTSTERVLPWALIGLGRRFATPPMPKYDRRAWEAFRRAAGLAGLELKAIRSTVATYMVSAEGMGPRDAAYYCGHSLAVAEVSYWGAPIRPKPTGESVTGWLGIEDLLA